jgi:threonine/homoserine/homoserine lactone efflux protein
MDVDYLPLITFIIATAGTPGPNNTMIFSSGASYGFRRSIPHVAGINIGFPLMVVAVGLGIGSVLERFPTVYNVLRVIAACYLVYLAYRIATAPVTKNPQVLRGRPLSFIRAALFQWVNPKTWVMAVGVVAAFAHASGGAYVLEVLVIALVFLIFGTPCTTAWLLAGMSLSRIFSKPLHLRVLNVALALLLVASLVPLFGDAFS